MFKRTKILQRHLEWAITYCSTNLDYYPESMDKWIVRLRGIDGPNDIYKNAEILFSVNMPANYPFDPPSFSCLTPNGRFETGGKICISIGEFHKEKYKKDLTISGFMSCIISLLLDTDYYDGIRLLNLKQEDIRMLSANSCKYNNINYRDIISKMNVNKQVLIDSGLWIEENNRLAECGTEKNREQFAKKMTMELFDSHCTNIANL